MHHVARQGKRIMTDSFKWIKRHLEKLSYKWEPRGRAMNKARRISQLADKRTKWQYQCNSCKSWFKGKEVQLDHIIPKGLYTKKTFFVWLDRLFCETDGFQVLCIVCHKKKSVTEHEQGAYK
jgi:5-methylcytosine-specific restriction endonuclease McrA